jgi:hypothetical protein
MDLAPWQWRNCWQYQRYSTLTSYYCVANSSLQVVNKLRLSFSSTKELNGIIDKVLPGRPPFETCPLVIGGETLELHFQDVLACI